MDRVTSIGIGGVNLHLSSIDRVALEPPDAGYESFVDHLASGPDAINIKITLELGNVPRPADFEKIFDCGETWSMFARGNERLVIHKHQQNSSPLWAGHMSSSSPDVTVYCGEELVTRSNGKALVRNPVSYPLDLILLMYLLAEGKGAVVHCAGVNIGGNGFIFPGCSGAGKSTLANLLATRRDVDILGDDRIIARKAENSMRIFGTPWLGTAARCRNESAPLKGIAFIGRGQASSFKRIPISEALERILPLVSVPWFDKAVMPHVLQFCEELVSATPCYELLFRPDNSVLDALDAMLTDCLKT
jgi:hypothetical protein